MQKGFNDQLGIKRTDSVLDSLEVAGGIKLAEFSGNINSENRTVKN